MADFGLIECDRVGCGKTFTRIRQAQRYCSKECRVADAVDRFRGKEEAITTSATVLDTGQPITRPPGAILGPQEAPQAPSYGFGRPLQGDDYPLEYYEDGYPKLPAPLDRRVRP